MQLHISDIKQAHMPFLNKNSTFHIFFVYLRKAQHILFKSAGRNACHLNFNHLKQTSDNVMFTQQNPKRLP